MVLAEAPRALVDLGAASAAVTAVIVLATLLTKARPVRWLWRTTIAVPLAAWFRAQVAHEIEPRIAEVRAELRPNGGSSAYDRLSLRLADLESSQRKIFARLAPEARSLADEEDPAED